MSRKGDGEKLSAIAITSTVTCARNGSAPQNVRHAAFNMMRRAAKQTETTDDIPGMAIVFTPFIATPPET
jgi:hypothetical protein